MSGVNDVTVRHVDPEVLRRQQERQAELEREAARLREQVAAARAVADRARGSAREAELQHDTLDARVTALQASLVATNVALRDLQTRSAHVSHSLAATISAARAAAGRADADADAADAELKRLDRMRASLDDELRAAREALQRHDLSALAPARQAAATADARLAELDRSNARTLAVLAALASDPVLGALADAMVSEAEAVGLSVVDAWVEGAAWEIAFRDAEGRLFRLAEAERSQSAVAARDARLAVLVGNAALGDAACGLTLRRLVERLRRRGIAVTVRTGTGHGRRDARVRLQEKT